MPMNIQNKLCSFLKCFISNTDISRVVDKLIINRGTREGVAVGMKFDIGKVEEVVDDDTGEVIDSSMTKLGTVTVTEVKEKVSYTTPLEGAEKGMGVHPAK